MATVITQERYGRHCSHPDNRGSGDIVREYPSMKDPLSRTMVLRRAETSFQREAYTIMRGISPVVQENYLQLVWQQPKGTSISEDGLKKDVPWHQLTKQQMDMRLKVLFEEVQELIAKNRFALSTGQVPFLPMTVDHFFDEEYWYHNCGVSAINFVLFAFVNLCVCSRMHSTRCRATLPCR
jgi:hypothetical protein